MPRIALLANPESGGGEAGAVADLLAAEGADVTAFELEERERALALDPERIVVAGGDGSIGCAAALASRAGVPLAVVAVGTANDFARSLELPRETRDAVALAVRGTRTRTLELGAADGREFVNAVSAGLSPLAAREAHGLKRALGPLAYAVGGLRAGLTAQPITCRVRCDGAERYAGAAWQVTVAVTGAFGGGAEIESDPSDGLLDVAVIEAGSRARLVLHAYGMRSGRLQRQRNVSDLRGREVEVEVEGGTGFNVDGELVDADSLRLTVTPRAYEVVVG